MTRKRVVLVLGVALLGAGVLGTALSVHAWRGRSAACYHPAGTWIGTNNYGSTFIVSMTPWGVPRTKLTVVADGINEVSWGGTFPPPDFGGPAVADTRQRGWAVKTGRNTYDMTLVALGTNAEFQVVYVQVISISAVLTDFDAAESSGTAAFFAPDQDPFGDEPPAFGCVPMTATFKRVPMVPPCDL